MSLPHIVDLSTASLAVKRGLLRRIGFPGPACLFHRVGDEFEHGPVVHTSHEALRNLAPQCMDDQLSGRNPIPPLLGTERSIGRLDSKLFSRPGGALDLFDEFRIVLQPVNDDHGSLPLVRIASILCQGGDGLEDAFGLGEDRIFEDGLVGDEGVHCADAADGGVERDRRARRRCGRRFPRRSPS